MATAKHTVPEVDPAMKAIGGSKSPVVELAGFVASADDQYVQLYLSRTAAIFVELATTTIRYSMPDEDETGRTVMYVDADADVSYAVRTVTTAKEIFGSGLFAKTTPIGLPGQDKDAACWHVCSSFGGPIGSQVWLDCMSRCRGDDTIVGRL